MEEEQYSKAQIYVNELLEDGAKVACDETNFTFNNNEELPPFYDEAKFKRGQQFYHDNIFAMFLGKVLGLLTLLAIPSIVKILMHTKMSSEPLTAYKRYMATIFHMCIWYDADFKPGSKLWQSISEVKFRHNSASKMSCTAGLGRISQKDMALTQFGFIGFTLVRPNLIGIHNPKKEDLEAIMHMWNVIGYVLGIQDRYNLCRETLEETQEICTILIEKVFKDAVEKKDPDFLKMSTALINGMWCMNPALEVNLFLNFLYKLLKYPTKIEYNNLFLPLNIIQYLFFKFMEFSVFMLQFKLIRMYHNFLQTFALWLMPRLPFLAYYSFGYRNSHVTILNTIDRKKG